MMIWVHFKSYWNQIYRSLGPMNILIRQCTLGNIRMDQNMVMEFRCGLMVQYTRANGKRTLHKELVDQSIVEGMFTLVNGFMTKLMDMGTYIHSDGAKYIGHWLDDKQHGDGIESWPDNSTFKGQYHMGKKHGKGEFKWKDGSQYIGEFDNNLIQGYGEYTWYDGRKFIGAWKNNKMEGQGVYYTSYLKIFTWTDGRKYKGEYKNDKKEGYGEFRWPDGRVYKGQWLNGKQHGVGVYIGESKAEKQGIWEDGKRIRWIHVGESIITD